LKYTLILFFFTTQIALAQGVGFFTNYRPLADSLSKIYGIPSCVILGVSYLESGGGVSTIAKRLNNHFGMVGNCNYEVSKYKSSYRYFKRPEDSYIAFCELVKRKKFYPQLKGTFDEQKWVRSIALTGYAADANKWTAAVMRIINSKCHQ
jgi:Bax protein